MNREDIDILEVGNAYTALFYKKNHSHQMIGWSIWKQQEGLQKKMLLILL